MQPPNDSKHAEEDDTPSSNPSAFSHASPQCSRGTEPCHCCLRSLSPNSCDCPAIRLVALNVRRLRMRKDLSQQELSSRANIHRTHLARFETQATNISLSILFRIARGLEVDPRDLLVPRSALPKTCEKK